MNDPLEKITRTEEEWKTLLSSEQFKIMRERSTEAPFTCALLTEKRAGTFYCGACGNPLFKSNDKFESGTGWPSFSEPISSDSLLEKTDPSYGIERIEVVCARCDSHLGHVFPDGPAPSGKRYCINGIALNFKPQEASPDA